MDVFCGGHKKWMSKNSTLIYDECLIDLFTFVPHVLLIIITIPIAVLANKKSRRSYDIGSWHEAAWPHFIAHNYRYVFNLFLIFFNILEICEGAIAQTLQSRTQLHLYLTPTISALASSATLVLYHNVEMSNNSRSLVSLLIYWVCTLALKVAKVVVLFSKDLNVPHLRFDLTWDVIIVYFGLLVVEILVLIKQAVKPAELFHDVVRSRFIHKFVNFLSKSTFWWLNRILLLGYRRPLEITDLGSIPEVERTTLHTSQLGRLYEGRKVKCTSKGDKPSLVLASLTAFWGEMLLAGILKFTADVVQFFGPFAIDGIVKYVERNGSTIDVNNVTKVDGNVYISLSDFMSNGFVLCVLLTLSVFLLNTLMHAHHYLQFLLAMRVRSGLQGMIYRKTLRLPLWTMTGSDMSHGQIVNHMSVDANQVLFGFFSIHFIWTVLVQFIAAVLMVYRILGWSALIAACWVFIILPINYKVTHLIASVQKKKMKISDNRIKMSNQLLQGIKLVKLYGWTDLFCSSIGEIRKKEVRCLIKAAFLNSMSAFLTETGPVLILVTTFVLYPFIQDEPLTTAKTLSALALMSIIKIPFEVFMFVFKFVLNGYVSIQRINKFLMYPEISGTEYENLDSSQKEVELKDAPSTVDSDHAVCVREASLKWSTNDDACYMKNINLDIKFGNFVMIVGEVGSGKSSLLLALLNEMSLVAGSLEWSKRATIAYSAQSPWLLNASLQDNILFGQPMDKSRYKEVIAACALQPDIDVLVAGDQTEIGEKGINLSGGQKQRVSVARALYSDANVIMMDDPFSALDVHTGRHLFKEGVLKLLIQRNRTVILVTHHLQYMAHADKVLVMNNGQITHTGTLTELNSHHPDLFTGSWLTLTSNGAADNDVDSIGDIDDETEADDMTADLIKREPGDASSSCNGGSDNLDMDFENPAMSLENIATSSTSLNRRKGKLIQEEERKKGAISWHVYMTFLKACSLGLVVVALLLSLTQHGSLTGKDFWLSMWSEASQQNKTKSEENAALVYYLTGFVCLSLAGVVLTFLAVFLVVLAAIRGATNIHVDMLRHIVDAPMRFFDSTPVGRILNRFTADTNTIDEKMPETSRHLVQSVLMLLSAIVVSAVASSFSLIGIAVIGVFYVAIQKFFRKSSRELQRVENITKSPVFSHFTETLTGLSTIRAYGQRERFIQKANNHIDVSNLAFIVLHTVNRWLGIRLDYMGAVFTFIATISGIVAGLHGYTSAGIVGLAIVYALNVAIRLNWVVRHVIDFELHTNSVERLLHYTEMEKEPKTTTGTVYMPNEDWPSHGEVEFKDVSLQYSDTLPVVVHNLSAVIPGGAKVGLCGRTGSGKSSITLGLFRMIPMCTGSICIDKVDIGSVPLDNLRSQISIIPQDPTLFIGTVRSNLDPSKELSDDKLWHALEIAQLKSVVKSLEEGLDAPISEGGSNFSVGQCQLFCLARAFLRHSKILVMDEATASIDHDTDDLIQKVIGQVFKDTTVLIVAHRISTIMNCDMIMVMEEGHLVEFGEPSKLMENENGLFFSLVSAPTTL